MSADTGYAGAGAQDIQILLGSAKECPPNSWRVDSIGPPRPKRGYWIRCVESVPRGATRVWIIVVSEHQMPDYGEPAVEEQWVGARRAEVTGYLQREGVEHGPVGEWP